jgi:pimeloyl-ACP methyl ester carboxylesterase
LTGRALQTAGLGDRLSTINAPVLVLTGSDDVVSPSDAGRTLSARFARGQHAEIPGAGHFSALEQPEIFAAEVTAFLIGSRHLAS